MAHYDLYYMYMSCIQPLNPDLYIIKFKYRTYGFQLGTATNNTNLGYSLQ